MFWAEIVPSQRTVHPSEPTRSFFLGPRHNKKLDSISNSLPYPLFVCTRSKSLRPLRPLESQQCPLANTVESKKEASAGNTTRETPASGVSKHIKPREYDVLLGRGRPYQTYRGNLRMLQIIADHKSKYNARPRNEKRAYVDVVLDAIQSNGAKFLKHVDPGMENERWEEVDPLIAASKVWHALRAKGKKKPPKDSQRNTKETSDLPQDPNIPYQAQQNPLLSPALSFPMAAPAFPTAMATPTFPTAMATSARSQIMAAATPTVAASLSSFTVGGYGLPLSGVNLPNPQQQNILATLARLGNPDLQVRRSYINWRLPDHLCFPPYGQSGRRLRMLLENLSPRNTPGVYTDNDANLPQGREF